MDRFIAALQQQDVEAFLALFSTGQTWAYTGTLTETPRVDAVTYARLDADLHARQGLWEALFDAEGDDCFRDWVEGTGPEAWMETTPNRFVRERIDGREAVYVEWRQEGGRWFVAAIGDPAA
jgi:hypothetical protein